MRFQRMTSCIFALCFFCVIPSAWSQLPYGDSNKLLPMHLEAIQKAADHGDANAQTLLGSLYIEGRGVPQSNTKAREWFQKAAEQGHELAQYNLGGIYFEGRGVPQNYPKAAEWFQKAATQGYVDAQINFAVMNIEGLGVPKDDSKAVAWFQKAAEQGSSLAQYNLGVAFFDGRGVSQSYPKAAEWFQKAARQGHINAQINLGGMYLDGRGVSQDDNKAAEWFQKAAEQGNANAQYLLGVSFYHGRGVPKNYLNAIELLQKAADQGLSEAQIFMDTIKQDHIQHTPINEYAKIAIIIYIIIEPFILIAFLQQRAALEIGREFFGFDVTSLVRSKAWSISVQIIRLISWCSIACMFYFGKWYYSIIALIVSTALSTFVPVPKTFYRTTLMRLEKIGILKSSKSSEIS